MSFVWGAGNVAFLRQRFKEMSAHHCFYGMEYSEDRNKIADWAPLIMDGRDNKEPFAATRIITGSDVDYGALTHLLIKHLSDQPGFDVHYNRKVVGLDREHDGRWRVSVEDTNDGGVATVSAKFVFIGAGGGALTLLQKSKIPEGKGYGGFPVSGIWLRCDVDAVSHRHHAKVYGKAAVGSPPMSVPHLDTRIIGGKHSLLFGPYAGFSTRFLKHGELTDLFASLTFENIIPLLDVARDNLRLAEYLIGQVLESSNQQFATLKQFFPRAVKKDWKEAVAGQRVETIKPLESKGWLKHEEGELEFGTELVVAEDKSIVALLGASPGASTAAFIAIGVLEKCFKDELTANRWLAKLKEIILSYGESLIEDAVLTRRVRADTAAVLQLDNV
jgi:malate dehydrogenase (quinone)